MQPTGMMLPMVNWAFFSSINKMTAVHTFGSNKELLFDLVTIRLPKVNDGEWSTTTGIVNDVLHNTLDVTVSFSIVDRSKPGSSFPVFRVRHEDRSSSLTLSSYHTTHFFC